MAKTNRFIALFAAVLCFCMSATADTKLPAKVEIFFPEVLAQNLVRQKDIDNLGKDWGQKHAPANANPWVAYSDRSDNTTYNGPTKSSGVFGKLDFNEAVRIADIKDDFALVYNEPKRGLGHGRVSPEAVTKGWVPMSNLLLWHSCPVNEKDIYYKALLVLNLNNDVNGSSGYFYSDPASSKPAGEIITDMNFYFVMKTDPTSGRVLLSYQSRLDGASDQQLYGWVEPNSYTSWNQRSCLEPNWELEVVNYLNRPEGKEYDIYQDANLTKTVAKYKYAEPNDFDKNPNTQYRLDPYQLRFPILDNDSGNDNIYKCTFFEGGGFLNGNENKERAEDIRIIEGYRKKLQNINIIFVIDGTRSMQPYFSSVKNAIKKSLDYFDNSAVKVAVVIFRDYADGDALIECLPLTKTNDVRLAKFLDEIGTKGYGATSSPKDHTLTEALYKGLEKALDTKAIGYNADEANIMLVIGDCGNDPDDTQAMSQEEIIKKLADNKVQLISFQVENRTSDPWLQFNFQMQDIVKGNMAKQYAELNTKVKFKEVPFGYDIDNGHDKQFFVGAVRNPSEGKKMEADSLTNLIAKNIGNFADAIQTQINVLENLSNNSGFLGGGVQQKTSQFDEDYLKSILKDRYDEIKNRKVAMASNGYAPRRDVSGREFWKPIIFLSTAEFDNLLARLQPVYDKANEVKDSNNRKPYVDAVKGLLRAMVPDITDAEMDQKGLREVMNMISGLNVTSEALGYSLLDLQDIHKVKNDQFQSLVNDFCTKYDTLRRIRNKYTYVKEQNDIVYYWVPVEDLP